MHRDIYRIYFILFLGILVPFNLTGHAFGIPWLEQLSKPLLVPVLIGYFLNVTRGHSSKNRSLVLIALICAWVGDVALMFDSQYPILFIVGLSGFLLAHMHYIYVFVRSGKRIHSLPKIMWGVIPLFVLYTVGLLSKLWPYLNELQIPVFIYALVLMLMGIAAMVRNVKTGYQCVLFGALLFVVSDSLLAFNKFITPLNNSGLYIMTTYSFAQLFIVLGVSKQIIKDR